ncbi:hypothetical protein ACFL6H_02645 [Candidatus Latescibacterota bacterium]
MDFPKTSQGFYYSPMYFARDFFGYIATFFTFIIVMFNLIPKDNANKFIETLYIFKLDTSFNKILLIVLLSFIGYSFGVINTYSIRIVDIIIRKLGLKGYYRFTDFYKKSETDINNMYNEVFANEKLRFKTHDDILMLKLNSLLYYARIINPDGGTLIQRMYGKLDIFDQASSYCLFIIILLPFYWNYFKSPFLTIIIAIAVLIVLMVRRQLLKKSASRVEFELIVGSINYFYNKRTTKAETTD